MLLLRQLDASWLGICTRMHFSPAYVCVQVLLWWHRPPCCPVTMGLLPRSSASSWSATSTPASGGWDPRSVTCVLCPPPPPPQHTRTHIVSGCMIPTPLSRLAAQCHPHCHAWLLSSTTIVMAGCTIPPPLSCLAAQFLHHCHDWLHNSSTIVMAGCTIDHPKR